MNFIENIKTRAKLDVKTIVLPEASDIRTIKAAQMVLNEGFAHIVLVGKKDEITKLANENSIDISKATIVEPESSAKKEEYAEKLYELRKHKGMTIEQAQELVLDPVYYGMMMVKQEEADGLVSGAIHSTADTLRPALQILKTAPGTKLVSAFFLMEVPNCEYGDNGTFVFADCGLNPNPNEEELAEIAASSAKSFESLTGSNAKVAMLSYSTHGSGKDVDKVVNATKIAKENYPELILDGELQLDSAIVPEVAELKAPNSILKGEANVLVFPDLNAGNIGYKLVQRLAKANAYGPICQGIAKPVNDLSRGCSAEDIAGVVAITAVQSQKGEN
ncbi:MAG: phosphate acetyltransferase [Clostridia bacterium]|nr:phosphate acetyltransferase [Clostridia bacterium]